MSKGKGDEATWFDDVNTGPRGTYAMKLHTTARIFFSFYGPDSQASIPEQHRQAECAASLGRGRQRSDAEERAGIRFRQGAAQSAQPLRHRRGHAPRDPGRRARGSARLAQRAGEAVNRSTRCLHPLRQAGIKIYAAFLLPRISSRRICRRVSAMSAWCTDDFSVSLMSV